MDALQGNLALFRLSVDGCEDELRVVRFHAREALSSLFELRVEIAGDELRLADLIGRAATLTIEAIDAPRLIHGFVCQAEHTGDSRRYALHELVIVPWIWRLQQRAGCRIFQGQSTPEILTAVLLEAGLPRTQFRLDLSGTYVPRDYCVQYNESDLDFLNRLTESDGIYYYFDHSKAPHVLVLTDRREAGRPPGGEHSLSWGPSTGIVHESEHVTRFRLSEAMRPERVALRDFNVHSPAPSLDVASGEGAREIYDYPGGYQQLGRGGPHLGESQSRLRLEALRASALRGFGESDSPHLMPGHAFTLTGHGRADYNGEYRILAVDHRGEQPQALDEDAAGAFHYSNTFECMPNRAPYRAPRLTPRPTVRGVQTATVVGPPGDPAEEIWVDGHGRVKIEFHWDRRDLGDDRSSCWVRVGQAWAGDGFGAMFLPRVGHEVIVDFIEGDPDRPIITGRIYTGTNTPPYALPAHKTRSTIKTKSSPGAGSNELRFEDAKGSEEVYLHAQRDHTIEVENDERRTIGRDESREVGRDERETIGHDRTIAVGNDHTETIGNDMHLSIGGNASEQVGGGVTVQVAENVTETAGQNISLAAGKHLSIRTGENINLSAGKKANIVVADKMTIECGAVTITVHSSGAVSIRAATLDVQAAGAVTVRGGTIKIN